MDARLPELLQIVTAIGKKGNFVSFFRPTGTTAPGSISRECRQQSPHPSPRPRAPMPTNDHPLLQPRGSSTGFAAKQTAASTRILFAGSQALSSRVDRHHPCESAGPFRSGNATLQSSESRLSLRDPARERQGRQGMRVSAGGGSRPGSRSHSTTRPGHD